MLAIENSKIFENFKYTVCHIHYSTLYNCDIVTCYLLLYNTHLPLGIWTLHLCHPRQIYLKFQTQSCTAKLFFLMILLLLVVDHDILGYHQLSQFRKTLVQQLGNEFGQHY